MASIGYARVSTTDQHPELQLDALRDAGCGEVYADKASGARADRIELAKAIEAASAGDVLVVWRLDRLARSVKQLIALMERLEAKGVGFRSLTDPIDTTSPAGKLVFHLFGALAEFERGLIRERTVAGLAAARRAGDAGARSQSGRRLAGRAGRDRLPEDRIAAARRELADGATVTAAARRAGISPATLYRRLAA